MATAPSEHRARGAAGFTLIEVLVAMMIMAIMGVMAWQGVDGIVRARNSSNERLEKQLRLNTVLAQWEQDLLSIQETRLAGAPSLRFDGSTLRLTRRTPAGVQVVAWSVRGNSWLRWASPPVTSSGELQDSWQRTQQLLGNETGQLRVMNGVTGWQIYFFQGTAWANAQSTGDISARSTQSASLPPLDPQTGAGGNTNTNNTTNTNTATALPAAVRLVMTFNGDGLSGTLTRDIVLGPQP